MINKKSRHAVMKPIAYYLPALIGYLILAAGIAYCLRNGSSHSGFDPRFSVVFFVPVLVAGIGFWHRNHYTVSLVSFVVGTLGIGFGYFVHHMGIMQNYDYWASNGLQPRNPNSVMLLLAYAGFSVMGLVITIRRFKNP